MAKQAQAAKAPATPKAVKAKPEQAIVTIQSTAMSKDVGPAVIIAWNKSLADEQKAQTMLNGVKAKQYDTMAVTTEAIAKAAKADKSIDLSKAFSDDKAEKEKLNTQIGLALGFREYTENEKGKKRLVFASSVVKYFPSPKDTKDSPEAKRKSTFRSNFIHMIGKCAQAACAVVENQITVRQDKANGTLAISGPKVQEVFGAKEVLLNEKQTVAGEKPGDSVQLKERPSFSKLAEIASLVHGGTVKGKRTAAPAPAAPVDPEVALESLCNSLVRAIAAMGKLSDRARKALQTVELAVDKALTPANGK